MDALELGPVHEGRGVGDAGAAGGEPDHSQGGAHHGDATAEADSQLLGRLLVEDRLTGAGRAAVDEAGASAAGVGVVTDEVGELSSLGSGDGAGREPDRGGPGDAGHGRSRRDGLGP